MTESYMAAQYLHVHTSDAARYQLFCDVTADNSTSAERTSTLGEAQPRRKAPAIGLTQHKCHL